MEKFLTLLNGTIVLVKQSLDKLVASGEKTTKALDSLSAELKSQKAPIVNVSVPKMKLDGVETVTIKGEPGKDGKDGKDGAPGRDGKDGQDGKDGITPVKGQDYFTQEEIKRFVREATPVKGTHYQDGKDGKDGFDGHDGKDGKDGNDGENGKTPAHKWKGTKLSFELPDGNWGEYVDLRGERGPGSMFSVAGGKGGASIGVSNKGTQITAGVTSFNFTGSGVTATSSGDDVTVNITGGSGGGYTLYPVTSASYTITDTSGDIVVLCNYPTGGCLVNLPSASGNTAKITVKKIDSSSNQVTIDGFGSETIDGATNQTIQYQYTSTTFISDGTNWFII